MFLGYFLLSHSQALRDFFGHNFLGINCDFLQEQNSQGAKVPGTKWPGTERARERKDQEVNSPARERIGQGPIGRFAPGSALVRERKGSVPTQPQ